jgi:hypothetical protein
VVKQSDGKTRLPFNWGFVGGILIVVLAREVAQALDVDWLLYVGLAVGGALCVRAVLLALRDL